MAKVRNPSLALIRDVNRAAVLALIGTRGPIARAEIARELSLSPATVTAVTRELVTRGIVRVVDQVPSRGGRPALRLALVPEAGHVLGVKIAADHLAGVVVDLEGQVVDRFELPFVAANPDVVEQLAAAIRPFVTSRARGETPLLGIGLGVPGIVGAKEPGSVEAPSLSWDRLDLGRELRDRLGVPVLVENDVNTLAIAERLYGRGRDLEDFVTVTIGRGVGLGIVARGDLYRGARGGAGELGHVTVRPGGPPCSCGRRGCLEALVADPALLQEANRQGVLPPGATPDDLLALARSGDPRAMAIYRQAGELLGEAVAFVVNLVDPQLVLLSGEGIRAWPYLTHGFEATFRAGLFPPVRAVPVEVDPWDDARWARGAAALVLRSTFTASLFDGDESDDVRVRLGGLGGGDAGERAAERSEDLTSPVPA